MAVGTEFMRGWLSGFFDGEGSATFRTHVGGRRHTNYYLTVGNTDLDLINTCIEYLDALGIEYMKYYQNTSPRGDGCKRKAFYVIHICKAEDILWFAEMVGFISPGKQAILDQIVKWIGRKKEVLVDG